MSDTDNDGFERGLTEEEMIEQFAYDPFGKDAQAGEPEGAGETGTAEPAPSASGDGGVVSTEPASALPVAAAAAAPPAPEPPTAPAIPAAPSQTEIELAALKSTIAELSRKLAEKEVASAPPTPSSAAAPAAPPADDIPPYEFSMPKALVDGLASEDPNERAGALTFLVKETSRVIHKTVVEQMRKEMESLAPSIAEGIESRGRIQATREAIRQDFFATFPLLAKPELQPLVQSITAKVMAETGISEWNQTLRDAIGARAYSVLGAAMPQARPAVTAPPMTTTRAVAAPPPVSFAGSARPAGAGRVGAVDEVYDTLFGQG